MADRIAGGAELRIGDAHQAALRIIAAPGDFPSGIRDLGEAVHAEINLSLFLQRLLVGIYTSDGRSHPPHFITIITIRLSRARLRASAAAGRNHVSNNRLGKPYQSFMEADQARSDIL